MKKYILGGFILVLIFSIYCFCNINFEMNVNGDEDILLKCNAKYEELGANLKVLNKDLSSNVKITNNVDTTKPGTYEVVYEYQPRFKKKITKVRHIKVIDDESPVIKLKGKENITLDYNTKYKEEGYEAVDNVDGDITNKVEVKNDVNIKTAGKYKITYLVTDSSGNKKEVFRNIEVKAKKVVKKETKKEPKKKYSSSSLAILMYHYFYDKKDKPSNLNSNYMEIKDFEAQMKYLHDNNYYYPTWSEVADFIAGKKTLPKKSIVITIDDGQKSFFKLAIPILTKYQVKATSFIITSKSGAKKIAKYKSEYINFESHTHNMHQGGCTGGHGGLFRCISYKKGLEDLHKTIEIIGDNDVLAYPYGDVNANVIKITKAAGYKLGVTTNYGKARPGMDPLKLPRVRMSRGISLQGFKNSI